MTDTRIRYVYQRNNIQYRKKLLDTFTTDTGFDVVCLSCLQFKSIHYCKSISKLDTEKRRQFLVEDYIFARTKYGANFVYNICFQSISKGERPKKSRIDAIKFENFPINFLQSLQRKCISIDKDYLTEEDLSLEVQSFKLNRLESYLLKLIIPFIRIAHCPRSHYFKLKGDLILISSDISSTI